MKNRTRSKVLPCKCNTKRRNEFETKLYLAYGSNLNLGQMAHRCPDSKVAGKAELPGYRLLFRGGQHNAHATIEKSEGHTVPALLWKVSVRTKHC